MTLPSPSLSFHITTVEATTVAQSISGQPECSKQWVSMKHTVGHSNDHKPLS